MSSPFKLSVVIPTYNEEKNIPVIHERLRNVLEPLTNDWEIIFSVDPSTDQTETIIKELNQTDNRVKMLRFSRKFGQPAATLAGLATAIGDACIVIDCDLQDPPEVITELVKEWQEGYEVVYAQRRSRQGETLVKRAIAAVGYKVLRRISDVDIPPNTGDFRLMSRRVVDNVISLNESHGFLRGLVAVVGFKQTSVLYDRDERLAGKSNYNRFWGSLLIGFNGIVGFSRYPLHFISLTGLFLSFLAFLLSITYFILKVTGIVFPTGNPTIVILLSFFSGIQLLSLGIMGEYVGRIYDEVKNRPKWIVESSIGIDESENA